MIDKITRDGFVAVIISGGYGMGWSTWHTGDQEEYTSMVFDPAIVELIRIRDANNQLITESRYDVNSKIKNYCQLRYGYTVDNLEVEWVKEGTRFKIIEYDGDEYLITENDLEFIA